MIAQEYNLKDIFSFILVIFLSVLTVNAEQAPAEQSPNTDNIKWEQQISNPDDPAELVKVKWEAMVKVIEAGELELDQKNQLIDKIVDPIFDYSLMSKLALGKKNWGKLSDQQKDEYTKLFIQRMKTSYRQKMSLFDKRQESVFLPIVENKSSVEVPMELVSEDAKMKILYKLRKLEAGWKIYDVELEGVSIVLTYRSQFDDLLSHGSVDEFLAQLKLPEKTES